MTDEEFTQRMSAADRRIAELLAEVERLRAALLDAFVAGAVWAVKGLPILSDTVQGAAQSAGQRWLTEHDIDK